MRTKSAPKQKKIIQIIKNSYIQPILKKNKKISINQNQNFEEEIINHKINNYSINKLEKNNIDNLHEKNIKISFISRNPNYKSYNNFENIKEAKIKCNKRNRTIYQNFYHQNINNYSGNEIITKNVLTDEKFDENKEQNSIRKKNSKYINNIFKEGNYNILNNNKSFYYKKNSNLNLNENENLTKTFNNTQSKIYYRDPIILNLKINSPLYEIIFNPPIELNSNN